MKRGYSRRILVLEPDLYGHKFDYTRYLMNQALADGHEVFAAVQPHKTGGRRDRELREQYGSHIRYVEVTDRQVVLSTLRDVMNRGEFWTDVVVPSGDLLIKELALLPLRRLPFGHETRLRCLFMRPPVAGLVSYRNYQKILALKSARRHPGCSVACLVGPGMRTHGGDVVPDPIEILGSGHQLPPELCWLDPAVFWFGVVGTIYPRKNPFLVAKALAAGSHSQSVGLVIAGPWDDQIWRRRQEISRILTSVGNSNYAFINRGLTDEEVDSLIAFLDAVVIAHTNEGSSGILGRASALGTRIVAAGATSLRQDAEVVGGQWSRLRPDALKKACLRSVESPKPDPNPAATAEDFATSLLYGKERVYESSGWSHGSL